MLLYNYEVDQSLIKENITSRTAIWQFLYEINSLYLKKGLFLNKKGIKIILIYEIFSLSISLFMFSNYFKVHIKNLQNAMNL